MHTTKVTSVCRLFKKGLVRDGEVLFADQAAVCAEAQVQAEKVARRVAADPVHKEMVLLETMEAG